MRVEVDVLQAVLTGSVQSLCCSLGAVCWSNGLAADRVPLCVEVDVQHVAFARRVWSLC
jgi:predicted RNA methylase